MSRIAVTGGAGFIGWRACKQLAGAGHEIAILDNLSVGLPMPDDKDYRVSVADVRDEAAVLGFIGSFKPDTIIHLAAVHHIPTCEKRRAYALDANVKGTEVVLDAAEKSGVARVVIASSGAVYSWHDGPLIEDVTPLDPCDNYALSKYANEMQLRFWTQRTGAAGIACRIFNTIGHDDPNAHLIPDILNQLHNAKGKVTISLGNLKPRRDYIHANDTSAGIAAIATAGVEAGFDIFNVASGRETSVADLVRMIGDAMGVEIDIVQSEQRIRRVDRMSQLADMSKTNARFGWAAQTGLREAVADIVANFNFGQSAHA